MDKTKLNPIQIMTLVSAGILGVDILKVQRNIVEKAGRDAWISIILGGLLTFISGVLAYWFAQQYPDKDLPEAFIEIAGKFLGRLLIAAVSLYFILYLGYSLKVFAQALLIFLMDRTPIFVLILLMSLVSGYAVFKGLETIGKVVDILFPATILTVLFVLVLALPQAQPIQLKPILYNNTDNVLRAVLPSFQRYTGAGLILYFIKYTRKTKATFLWYLAGLAIPLVSYVSLTLIVIMVFGTKETLTLIYPTLTLVKAIQFPVTFLERLESFAAVFWIGIVFNATTLFYYASVRNAVVLFSIPEKYKSYVVWAHIPILMVIGLSQDQVWKVMQNLESARQFQSILVLVLLPLLSGYTLLKKRRRKPNENTK